MARKTKEVMPEDIAAMTLEQAESENNKYDGAEFDELIAERDRAQKAVEEFMFRRRMIQQHYVNLLLEKRKANGIEE